MKIFQQTPCRLYPQIINLVKKQFPTSFFVHEVYSFKNNFNDRNPLNITKNDYIFPRCDFIYGIFDAKKIKKEKGDFCFTIEIPQEKKIEELFCAVKHYGSVKFGYSSREDKYDSYLHKLLKPLYYFNLNDMEYLYNNNKVNDVINDEIYNLRMDFTKNNKFDYVGNFDNWSETIVDIKKNVGLDLSSLSSENPYSYKYKKV